MNYREINWPRLKDRYSRWWKGELETPIFYISVWPGPAAGVEPRPKDPAAVKRWFMDPETRMRREIAIAKHSCYFADGFPSVDIGRINIGQASFYGCPTHFAHETIWVDPILAEWDGWEGKIRFDEGNELWRLTLAQGRKAVELAEGDVCITMLGGFEGPLDNLSAVRGVENALLDVVENPDEVLALERRFLDDFKRYYFSLYEILRGNPRGVCLWSRALMTDGPAHCMQSDFSCMVSPEICRRLGLWYLREQARMFAGTIYHLDGSNALHHLPMLLEMEELDCVQFIYQIPAGKRLIESVDVFRRILDSGKRAEVFAWDIDDVIPALRQLPPKGLKMNIYPPDPQAAEALVREIRDLGYPVD